ncbi:phospholipid-binding protein [Rhodobacterales bacterium HKCCE2091]|nr:phospholipid-binding protein [Rhodobacterales bacterium HKCCE2091]
MTRLLQRLALCLLPFLLATGAHADAHHGFSVQFEWGNIPHCTSGYPSEVPSPRFTIYGLPYGTDRVEFRMVDLDAPGYNHGGATLRMSQGGTLRPGIFTYRGPCPPHGSHTYQWIVTARNGNQVLGTAYAERRYPH